MRLYPFCWLQQEHILGGVKIILNRDRVAAPQKVQAVDSGSPGNREGKGVSQRTGEVTIPPGNPGTKRIIIVAEETLKTDEETVITHVEGVLQGLSINLTADYSRNNDKDDFRKLAGKRAGSHPNLLDISKGWDSDQRGRSNEKLQNQRRTPRVNNLDYRALKKIFEMEPSEVVMKLASPGSGLKEFLSHEDMTDELIAIALEVLSKACSSKSNRENLQHLLIDVKESRFLKRLLPMYVMRVSRHNDSVKREQSIVQVDQILALHQTLISVFPASTILDVSLIVALLQTEITYLQSTGLTIPKETENSITSLQRIITHLQEKKREGTLRSDNYTYITGNEEELDIEDFRYMSIFPTYEDIHLTAKPFMRPNIIGQKFEDTKTYLDTHFRLLREDFIRPLRDGINQVLKFDGKDLRKGRFDDIRIYLNAYILSPICTHKGILYRVQFGIDNLKSVNWESSKRLLYGALVCLSRDNFETMIFATVANRDVKDLQKGITTLDFTEESRLKLSEFQENDYFLMVETTAFFEAYRHVLGGLKEMALGELPMQKYIVSCDTNISSPQYLINHRHTYSLQSLTTEGPVRIQELEKSVSTEESDGADKSDTDDFLGRQDFKELLGLPWRCDVLNFADWPSKQWLKLDDSQLQAVQMALTKELAIIQGPPGTGKTYIGLKIVKTILSNSNTWRSMGGCPILVVCYTNHALDQFLEGIHKFLKTGLVRVGGRCASEVLQKFSLNNLRRDNMFKQNLPGHLRAMYSVLTENRKSVEEKIQKKAALFESAAKGVLHENVLEDIIISLHGTNLGNVQAVENSRKKKAPSLMLEWLGISLLSHMSRQIGDEDTNQRDSETADCGDKDLAQVAHEEKSHDSKESPGIENCSENEEQNLYESENEETEQDNEGRADEDLNKPGIGEWKSYADDVTKAAELLKLADTQEEDLLLDCQELCKNTVVAMDVYRQCQIDDYGFIAKILEYENEYQRTVNRITELRNQEDQTILKMAYVIGMTTTCAARYRKVLQDIQPKIVVVEEAAEVLEAHIVTTLTSGCEHLILIGDHQQLRPSATVYELAKNFNLEVSLFERLIRMNVPYVRLDYQHRMRPEIARLLTPHIYDKLENHDSVCLYDNIKIPNRVCVALSRAKKGLFCIGNMSMLSTVPLWSKIMNVLRSNGQIGEALMVRCENHPETANFVSAAEDFLKVPQGGCSERCEYRLNCGHVCTRFCHPYDLEHKDFICTKPCSKTLCDNGHTCPKKCSAICGECKVTVTKTLPKCGHEQKVPCSEPPETFSCHMQCNKPLSCGHLCVRECGDTCTRKCPQNVTVNLDCGHQRTISCYEKQEAEKKNEKILCFVKCEASLQCGHKCSGSCSECSNGMSHVACRSKCKEVLICSHQCQNKCSEECVPCSLSCDRKCFHQKCDQMCCMPCRPCTQPCGWGCKHHQCTKLCFELCDRKPCELPCFRKLKCKHQCIGMCGEPCPKKCRICHADEVQEQFFGKEADPEARFVQLQDCNHIFEVTGFDTWMMTPVNDGPIKLIACPKCHAPIRRSVRYGSVIKRTLIEMEQVKKKTVEMCSTQLLISVTERDEMKRYFPLVLEMLLSKLDKADLMMPTLLLIKDQITILSKLAEIKKNVQLLLPVTFLRDKINKQIDVCSSNITKPIYINFLFEKEIIRISLLAEAYVMSYMHNKPVLSSTVMFAHIRRPQSLDNPKELEHIIHRLERGVMALKEEEEIKHIRKMLDSLQERLNLHMLFKILEEKNHKLLDGAIFRQGQWYKCSQGHVYWNQGSGSEPKVDQCPEC
ncbi:NFX1-type zinc finger-containing protein 1 [Acipenser ruthenus]|uniref:NFX1-type zinc finger-containing protein 1 n=1 Tax=Acipenser ruthenus TaxID=7906 RepID=A0A444V673_ACIRT|nr:NFX1-type zinc finger-containing protein 1 [Acipenser ruthenus]